MIQEFNIAEVESYLKYMKKYEHAYQYCNTETAKGAILIIKRTKLNIDAEKTTILLDFFHYILDKAKNMLDITIYCMRTHTVWPLYIRFSNDMKKLSDKIRNKKNIN